MTIYDKQLDDLLTTRKVEAPSTNLAYRITALAKEKGAMAVSKMPFHEQLLKMFVVPKPAYMTASCLLFGLAVGLYSNGLDNTAQDWFLFLEIDEGEWL